MARKQLLLKNVRCIYPNLDAPKAFEGMSETQAKYGIKVLIPKDDTETLKKIKDFVKDSIDSMGDWTKVIKDAVRKTAFDQSADNCIIKDGDAVNQKRVDIDEKDPVAAYTSNIVIGANRGQKLGAPAVFDQANNPMEPGLVAGSIVSGYWVNIAVTAFCYSKPKKGITFTLQAVQLVKAGEVFGQESPFEVIESADTDDVFSDEDDE